ncbi:MAG: sialate O-acetylesterase [Marinoscillum sp.]
MRFVGSLIFLAASLICEAQLKLPRLFADHMVFQRNQPTKVWGWTNPGEKVTILFDKETTKATANAEGYFEVFLKARKAGGPFVMSVADLDEKQSFEDILIGDVWIASGQSNMEWQLQWGVNGWEEEVKNAVYPNIRFFKVPNEYAFSPKKDVSGGEWLLANSENSPQFSAVAWFFAKRNHLDKNVPVGVIESHWGGTPAEAWTSIETLSQTTGYREIADTILNPNRSWEEIEQQNAANETRKWELMRDKDGAIASGAQKVSYDDSHWQTLDLPCNCQMTDLAWLRREVTLSKDSIEEVELFINNVVQEGFVFFNGDLIWSKQWNNDIKPLEIPKELIHDGKNVIAYRMANSWDNNVYFGRRDEMWLKVNGYKISIEGNWKYSNDVEPKIPKTIKMFQMPSFLYNAKIAPIGGYTARGVIWYQGESNAHQPQYYRELFGNMISDWRRLWGSDLPFIYVQLANFMQRQTTPQESQWAELRDAQTKTLELPKTAMAVTIDIGDANDIHPRNKKDVGDRLWLAAKKVSYGDEVIYSGPKVKSAKLEDGQVRLSFDHVGTGLKTKETLKGFALADGQGNWVWADAEIQGNEIVVRSSEISEPSVISYAWGDNPEATLYNKEGIPAVPFRINID